MSRDFRGFREFYPFYLSEHAHPTCRRLHFVGSTLVLACFIAVLFTRSLWWVAGAVFAGYGFAWIGHFVFEKNRPATFKHPVYSLVGDWVMFKDMLSGRIRW